MHYNHNCEIINLNSSRSLVHVNYLNELLNNQSCLNQILAATIVIGSEDIIIHSNISSKNE